MKRRTDVVIIGGGPAGRTVVHALHAAKAGLDVTLIKNEEVNVNRCAVPYGISPVKPEGKFLIPNTLVTDYGAELIIDQVRDIDIDRREVATEQGLTFSYTHLVLATGSRPVVPNLPGIEAQGITPVRSLDDMNRLRDWATHHQKAVIVGGGYIGLEVAAVLKSLGLGVTIVEMLPHILLATTEEEFAVQIEDHVRSKGIDIRAGAKVTAFAIEDGAVSGVHLADGEVVDADFAVLSVGVAPNTELAACAGLATSRYGITTDEHLRTSAPQVYASGDCAAKHSLITGRPTRGEFGTNAVFMSKVVAANILGGDRTFPGVINASVSSAFDLSFGSAGLTEEAARREGIDTVTGSSEVQDRYPMMDGASPIKTKLVFDRTTGGLVGGSVLRTGHCTAANVDFLSLALQKAVTLDDLLVHQYATHPELAAKPSDNAVVFAARDALSNR